ncbi:MAG: hypothetical protein D6765_13300, partial [Bacteroidetes bacterium]
MFAAKVRPPLQSRRPGFAAKWDGQGEGLPQSVRNSHLWSSKRHRWRDSTFTFPFAGRLATTATSTS